MCIDPRIAAYHDSDAARMHARAMIAKQSPQWTPMDVPPAATIKDGIAVANGQGEGKWKWAKPSGNCVENAYRQCNAHVDCKHVIRIAEVKGVGFCLYTNGMEHAAEATTKKRKNSILTWKDDAHLRKSMDEGATPGAMLVSMTKAKVKELKAQGLDPLMHKNEQGGLEGAHMSLTPLGCD